MLQTLIINIWQIFVDTAFWLLIGLLAAGAIKTLIPENAMQRWVGGRGIGAIIRAALFGAPLPLCSCGVLPTAIGLHRAGASKEATVSFLISTPETSIDSIAITYALMGPIMAIYRPLAALVSAILTGMMTALVPDDSIAGSAMEKENSCTSHSACAKTTTEAEPERVNKIETEADQNKTNSQAEMRSCCSSKAATTESSCCDSQAVVKKSKVIQILHYALIELLDDIKNWMAFGLVLAGVMMTFIPANWLAQWGHGLPAMLIMLVIGIPMYICAVASTPVAAGLLIAGVSPGAVLIFLLVGPATNIASFALLKQELGLKVTLVYLFGLAVISLMMGLLLELLLTTQNWQIEASIGQSQVILPALVSWLSAILLLVMAIKPVRTILFALLGLATRPSSSGIA